MYTLILTNISQTCMLHEGRQLLLDPFTAKRMKGVSLRHITIGFSSTTSNSNFEMFLKFQEVNNIEELFIIKFVEDCSSDLKFKVCM